MPPPELRTLHENFILQTAIYDRAARRWKNVLVGTWLAVSGLTWLTLMLAIAGMTLPQQTQFADLALHWLIPACGYLASALTFYQTLFGPQNRWLNYRAVVQELWNTAMLFRGGLPPFHDAAASQN